MKALSVTFLLFFSLPVVLCAFKRSARWDAHVSRLDRPERQASGCNYQTKGMGPVCLIPGVTSNDNRHRRRDRILAIPGDQGPGACGSCWAFAASHAYADAFGIRDNTRYFAFSPQFAASCLDDPRYVSEGNGCAGAKTLEAGFEFFRKYGAVPENCVAYHDVMKEWQKTEYIRFGVKRTYRPPVVYTCPAATKTRVTCDDGSRLNPRLSLLPDYERLETEAEIILALQRGPVLAGLEVTDAFMRYKCGVFCSSPDDKPVSNHAVEIVDYGIENNVRFWVVKNSWGVGWGEGGYFRIRRGDLMSDKFGYFAPVLDTEARQFSRGSSAFSACAPLGVTNMDSELIRSVREFVVDDINDGDDENSVGCFGSGNSTTVVLESVTEATTQVVDDGEVVIEMDMTVRFEGCGQVQRAVVSSIVTSEDDTFNITSFNYMQMLADSSVALSSSALNMLLAVVSVAFLLGYN